MEKVFTGAGDFEALRAAQAWCTGQGISYGSQQRGAPTGLMRGNYAISKWRNMSTTERADLDGTMTTPDGSFRYGPVTVHLKDAQ